MRWTAIVTGLAALAAAVFPAGGWAGQSRERDRELNIRFAQMDLNRDGVIDRKEWRGSAQSFRVHDWNGDGVLSNEEVRVGARRAERAGQPGPFDGWDREYEFTDWTQRGFERLDRNRDGRISRQEFPFERASFNRADHNRADRDRTTCASAREQRRVDRPRGSAVPPAAARPGALARHHPRDASSSWLRARSTSSMKSAR
jgi:hypothetical protein